MAAMAQNRYHLKIGWSTKNDNSDLWVCWHLIFAL
jgi:hypothetical protein